MSIIHDKLKKIEEGKNPGKTSWYMDKKAGEPLDLGLPKEIINDFYDLKEYVRIANMRGTMRVLSIASAHEKEGSSTVSAYLGFLLAGGMVEKVKKTAGTKTKASKENEKAFQKEFEKAVNQKPDSELFEFDPDDVLLVDANLRQPSIHTFFNKRVDVGLSDILEKGVDWKKTIKPVNGHHLKVITAGSVVSNPVELVGSDKFKNLLNEWQKQFKYVLIDSPAILSSAEALSLSAIVNGVILVVRSGSTRWDDAQAAKRKLVAAHAKLLGVTLNRSK